MIFVHTLHVTLDSKIHTLRYEGNVTFAQAIFNLVAVVRLILKVKINYSLMILKGKFTKMIEI